MKNPVGPVLRMSDDVDAIVAAIVEDNPGADRWTPLAAAAAAGLGRLFEQLPTSGRTADTVVAAATAARRRVLNEAGLAG